MHYVENNRKRKFVTLIGLEVCATVWWRIHGIPNSTFHTYTHQYKRGIVLGTHDNEGIKGPRLSSVQAVDAVATIIDERADQMPHQMHITQSGQMDTLKSIPGGETWKLIQAVAFEVCFLCS